MNVFLSDIPQVPENIRLWSPPWAIGAMAIANRAQGDRQTVGHGEGFEPGRFPRLITFLASATAGTRVAPPLPSDGISRVPCTAGSRSRQYATRGAETRLLPKSGRSA